MLTRLKEVTLVLFCLLLLSINTVFRIGVGATSNDLLPEKTWTYSPYNLENFTIIVLPDTQYYSEKYPEVFDNQTQWIVDNIESMNIVFVTHLGDLVDDWDVIEQWENANHSMSKLDGNVPWGVLAGNHDGVGPEQNNFQRYFGYDRFINQSWYGGVYQNNSKSNYQLFSAGGDDYLILQLQYDPSDDILEWASNVIKDYPFRRVIVSNHMYITWWWEGWRSPIGERVYNKLVKEHADQIFLVLCGHVDVVDTRTQEVNGYVVHELVFDYQEQSNGGNGWLKILEFSPSQDKIFVKTFSPYLNQFERDSASEFTLDYNMTSHLENITISSNSTLSDFTFNKAQKQISFKLSGEAGTLGYCNVSIPHNLLERSPWFITINEKLQEYTPYQNSTHTSLYFNYIHLNNLQVGVIGGGIIPEFPTYLVLPLFVIATLFAIAISKNVRKINH